MQFFIAPVTFRPHHMDPWLFLCIKETEKEREERREKDKKRNVICKMSLSITIYQESNITKET